MDHHIRERTVFWSYVTAITLYWLLRIAYFATHKEQIFSDIAVYVQIADQIYHHFNFGSGKYYAFFSPGTPVAIAVAKLVAGDSFASFYPYLIASINFAGVLILSRELGILTGRPWLGALFMLIAALLKPSIFWELKLSTEGLAEALVHLSLALTLWAWRKQQVGLAFSAGLVFAWLFLTRPQYVLVIPLLIWFFVARKSGEAPATHASQDPRQILSRRLALALSFVVGVALVWTPWLIRNYLHYGTVVPVSLAGAQTLIWDYGLAPIKKDEYTSITKDDGTIVPLDLNHALKFAAQAPTDMDFYLHLRELYNKWVALNFRHLWVPLLTRTSTVLGSNDHGGLSTLSRDYLFPWYLPRYNVPNRDNSPLNLILIDKNPTLMILGIFGLIFLQLRLGYGFLPVTALITLMWAVPGLTIGYPRVVEAQVGITIWAGIWLLYRIFSRLDQVHSAPKTGSSNY